MTKTRFSGLLAASIFLLMASCASKQEKTELSEFESGDVMGMVYNSENRPCQGARISINIKPPIVVRTDVGGRFLIPDIPGGHYQVTVEKDGHETNTFDFEYVSRKQVLYVKLTGISTLLDSAEAALDSLEWAAAQDALKRAALIDSEHTRYLLLMGAYSFRRGEYEDAIEYWTTLEAKGHRDPYLLLMIADSLQYGLDKRDEALVWIERYLDSREDPEVRSRYEELKTKNGD